MRTQTPRGGRRIRVTLLLLVAVGPAAIASGALPWLLAQTAALLTLHAPPHLTLVEAAQATWRLLLRGGWSTPTSAFPRAARHALPGLSGFLVAACVLLAAPVFTAWLCWSRLRRWGSGSPLALDPLGPRRWLRDTGWIRQRTWARPYDLRRLWIDGPTPGRPYLGWIGRPPRRRMLGAEREVQTLLVAPPRSGKSSGYIIPWLLDHRGPALVSSTKRDVYDATAAYRRRLGQVWVYDPFGPQTCSFSPLTNSVTWEGALRTAGALASAAHSEPASSAETFWDREAAMILAPLLHAAALAHQPISRVLYWLDTRDFDEAEQHLESAGMHAAAAQLRSVLMRDARNRETTIMSASSLLHAYRYPCVAQAAADDLTPAAFLEGNNTIYVVAAAHHQQDLQPVILALVCSIYEGAIEASRRNGPFHPPLYLLLDETANIAPIRDLAPWLSQCGDHGITIATSWQSIAQIDHRYGKDERDAILAASTAQLFLPPLADPTTTGYITNLLGEEPVTQTSHNRSSPTHDTLTVNEHNVAAAPWLRQIQRGHALLIYRDLPPAVTQAPGWYEDPRFSEYAFFARTGTRPIDRAQTIG